LDHFGIKSLDDLPNATELRRVKLPEADESQAATQTESTTAEQMSLPTVSEPSDRPVQDDLPMNRETESAPEVIDE
jgi:segregation and condensation protein B